MKIAHVVTRISGGGTEKNLLGALDNERRSGHHSTVFYGHIDDIGNSPLSECAQLVKVPHLQRKVSLREDMRATFALRKLLDGYDIVHTHHSKAGALGRLAVGRRTTTVVAHTVHMASFGDGYPKLSSRIYRGIERVCARRTDRLCFVGSELRDIYTAASVHPRGSGVVLRSPIDVDRFTLGRDLRVSRYAKSNYILAIGALEARKRYPLMIKNLAETLATTNFVLKIAGDGPLREQIVQAAVEYGISERVELLGHVSNIDELLAGAAALVHASAAEGVPQVVLQALIVGVPVIATDVEGLREVLTANISIGPRDGSTLGAQLTSVLAHPPQPVELKEFAEWKPERVDLRYSQFLGGLQDLSFSRTHERLGSAS